MHRYLFACFFIVGACGRTPEQASYIVRDSAGVRIVESTAALWLASEQFELDSLPELQIGSTDGDQAYQFSDISGAGRLLSGEIVVANAGTQEIRWYDPNGRYLRSAGRSGDGPGEFRGMRTLLIVPGDSVVVEDALQARVSMFTPDGTLLRTWSIEPVAAFSSPRPIGRFPDGRFAALVERPLSNPPGHVTYEATVVRYQNGELLDTLAVFPGGESYFVTCGPDNTAMCNVGVPFGRKPHLVVMESRIIAGNGSEYDLIGLDPNRGTASRYRRSTIARAVTPQDLGRFTDSLLSDYPEQRRAVALERLTSAPLPPRFPAFDQLMSDGAGRLWIGRPVRAEGTGRPWDVLDAEGRYLGTVSMPATLKVTQIGKDFVLGISKDAVGVEYVKLYRFRTAMVLDAP